MSESRYLWAINVSLLLFHACNNLVPHQSRGGVSHMVGICGQDVHSSQHLLAQPGVWHDASGPGLCYSTAQHVWSEEHLRSGHVRHTTHLHQWAVTCHDLCVTAQDSEAPTPAGGILRWLSVHLQRGPARWRRLCSCPKAQVRFTRSQCQYVQKYLKLTTTGNNNDPRKVSLSAGVFLHSSLLERRWVFAPFSSGCLTPARSR